MLGTPLTFLQLKWILTSCTKLQDLSISWPDDMESDNAKQWVGGFSEVKTVLSELKTLKIMIYANPMPLLELLIHCTGLKKLVIINHHARKFFSAPRIFSDKEYTLNFPHLQELIIDHLDGSFPLYLLAGLLLKISEGCQSSADWETFWTNTPVYINGNTFDNVAVIQKCSRVFLTLTPQIWDMLCKAGPLHNLKELLVTGQAPRSINLTSIIRSCPNLKSMNIMCGLNITLDMKKLCELQPKLERLSICCHPEQGPPKIVEGIATLRHLTHLTVPVCALIEIRHTKKSCITKAENLITVGFKRKRVGVPSTSNLEEVEIAAFNLVFENCPMITMLEIGFNTSTSCSPAKVHWECLENMKKLKRLTHLTLDGIPITNGLFLIEIAQGCQELKFLRLKHLGPSGKCCYLAHFSQALAHCRNLVNLRIEQNYLASGTALFKSLQGCEKLERVFIHSERDSQSFDIPAIDSFIEKQANLVFVFIVGSQTPKNKCAKLTRKYKNSFRPALVVCIRSALWDVFDDKNTEIRTIPVCHYNEMITFRSWTYDAFT